MINGWISLEWWTISSHIKGFALMVVEWAIEDSSIMMKMKWRTDNFVAAVAPIRSKPRSGHVAIRKQNLWPQR